MESGTGRSVGFCLVLPSSIVLIFAVYGESEPVIRHSDARARDEAGGEGEGEGRGDT